VIVALTSVAVVVGVVADDAGSVGVLAATLLYVSGTPAEVELVTSSYEVTQRSPHKIGHV